VKATAEDFTSEGFWPVHPLDFPDAKDPLRTLCFGAAGVIWALDYLHSEGETAPPPDFEEALSDLLEANRAAVAPFNLGTDSLLMGDAGILLLDWKRSHSHAVAAELARAISDNQGPLALEIM
jgi:hypothetical protein